MNTALVLAGGVGSRMGRIDRPKQYMEAGGVPVIVYCLRTLQRHEQIDAIVIVAAAPWQAFVLQWLEREKIRKFIGFADPGETRQYSIFNGLLAMEELAPETENVLIHDAARPFLTERLISDCIDGLAGAKGVMPTLPIKDTCYMSEDGKHIAGFLPRSQLFAGQAPEAFRFRPYLALHREMAPEVLKKISGSSEMAYKGGLDVIMVPGDERNIKITTGEDMKLAAQYLREMKL